MNYDMVKFERGQVWMIRFKKQEHVGREQAKDRPWLILSVGKYNKSSGMITAVPITSRGATCTPAQVRFQNERMQDNVILCEQIRSFDCMSGNYIFDFMGNLSDEVLEKVDVALSVHLGLHYSPITLNKLYDSMESIIKSVGHMQDKANTPKFSNEDVSKFADALASLASGSHVTTYSQQVAATKEDEESLPRGGYSSGYRDVPKDRSTEQSTQKITRIKWSPEKCKEFLHDAENLPMKEVMEKWNIEKKTRYYSMKNYASTILLKSEEQN